MNVLFVDWASTPKEIQLDILKNIPMGEYISSLPYNTSDYPAWKIPVPSPIALSRTEYIEFRKCWVLQRGNKYPHPIVKEMYAWERTH